MARLRNRRWLIDFVLRAEQFMDEHNIPAGRELTLPWAMCSSLGIRSGTLISGTRIKRGPKDTRPHMVAIQYPRVGTPPKE